MPEFVNTAHCWTAESNRHRGHCGRRNRRNTARLSKPLRALLSPLLLTPRAASSTSRLTRKTVGREDLSHLLQLDVKETVLSVCCGGGSSTVAPASFNHAWVANVLSYACHLVQDNTANGRELPTWCPRILVRCPIPTVGTPQRNVAGWLRQSAPGLRSYSAALNASRRLATSRVPMRRNDAMAAKFLAQGFDSPCSQE